jgi:hypothetical protein
VVGMIITAQEDSPQAAYSTPFCDAATQSARGDAYVSNLTAFFNSKGRDGIMPVIGMSWWEWTDKNTRGESGNFGLVTNRDNAYDGTEDKTAPCADSWGYKCGGEQRNYGDFLTAVKEVNRSLDEALVKFYRAHH